jgi:hypothetical protein
MQSCHKNPLQPCWVAYRLMNCLVFGRWPVHIPQIVNEAFIFSSVPGRKCRYGTSTWAKIFFLPNTFHFALHPNTHLHLVPTELKSRKAIPPLPRTSSWRGTYLIEHKGNCTFTLPLEFILVEVLDMNTYIWWECDRFRRHIYFPTF